MKSRTRIVLSSVVILGPMLFVAPFLSAQISFKFSTAKAESAEKLKAVDEEIRQSMLVMTRQLGITCNHCHNPENFKADEKPAFKLAKEHMKLTQVLIDNGMDGKNGKPKADCFMCHRGALKPNYKEVVDPMQK